MRKSGCSLMSGQGVHNESDICGKGGGGDKMLKSGGIMIQLMEMAKDDKIDGKSSDVKGETKGTLSLFYLEERGCKPHTCTHIDSLSLGLPFLPIPSPPVPSTHHSSLSS